MDDAADRECADGGLVFLQASSPSKVEGCTKVLFSLNPRDA